VPALSEITLAVLAGGEGSRMGMPKGLLRIGNQPILDYLLDRLAWPGPTMLVTAPAREHPPGWTRFDREVIDPVAGLGPLRGVLTSLENAATEWVSVVTVDMPGIGREQLEGLLVSISADDAGKMYAHRDERIEPFPLLIRTQAASILRQRVERHELSVTKLLEEKSFGACDVPGRWGDEIWFNLNRPEDLERFRHRA
jgi:molybdopterin-guanine dinucleotide biosynthesis protein A